MTPLPLSRRLVREFRRLRDAALPPDIAAKTRLHVADAAGIGIAATRDTAWLDRLVRGVAPAGERGPCATFVPGLSLPPLQAAFVNSALVHALDFDDIHDRARLHPTVVTLPAALAAADAGGDRARTVEAVAIANEFLCRVGSACAPSGTGPGSDWFLTQLFGYFAATLAAGIAWGLEDEALVSALGFAYMQAAGGKEAGFGVGSNARSIYPAYAALGGVQAAAMARAGLVGPETALDGAAGFFKLYLGAALDEAREAALFATDRWAFAETDLKPWPCCRLSHPYVASAFEARRELGDREARRIVVAVNASAAKLCSPLARRRRPTTLQDAKYSIPFMTAFALAHGRVGLDNLGDAALADARVLDLAARIEVDARLPDNPGHPPAEVTVEVAGGPAILAKALPPATDEATAREKFLRCLEHAGRTTEAEGLWQRILATGSWPSAGG